MARASPAMRLWMTAALMAGVLVGLCGSAGLQEQCSSAFEKVANCLGYTTGKAAAPTKECCTSVGEMRSSQPACLCFFILETHKGSPQIKQLGVQEAKLLELPSACKLVNASITDCPKQLNIPSTSPDYSIFTKNATSSANATATPETSSPPSSDGSKHEPHLTGPVLISVASTLLIYAFSEGLVSKFYAV
ncbi:non-specific lipid transfer protein GPI-anchored 1 [Malania oleifera]|uniref:non-specific lipid transfer protein GPI-anchored 1 n=1 Tax=Malania oleifera TaxID=397392 RepID=UPI0025ADFF7A|nr:non-specific lipid transfer protein GPI-anchored 1 [Malania oleifera]